MQEGQCDYVETFNTRYVVHNRNNENESAEYQLGLRASVYWHGRDRDPADRIRTTLIELGIVTKIDTYTGFAATSFNLNSLWCCFNEV